MNFLWRTYLLKKWDESQHPRAPAGTSAGGEFAGAGAFDAADRAGRAIYDRDAVQTAREIGISVMEDAAEAEGEAHRYQLGLATAAQAEHVATQALPGLHFSHGVATVRLEHASEGGAQAAQRKGEGLAARVRDYGRRANLPASALAVSLRQVRDAHVFTVQTGAEA